MSTKKYLSYTGLAEYDKLIKGEISEGDAATLASANAYADQLAAGKSDSNHSHDGRYYTESEIDSKLSTINTSITNITSGTTVVKEAEHATTADSATTATSATSATKATQDGNGKVISSTYETKTDASAKLTEAKGYTDTRVDGLTNDVGELIIILYGTDIPDSPDSPDELLSIREIANDESTTALNSAKSYADTAAANVKNDLLNGAGAAYDTLKELGDLIADNKDAIDALETVASGKADKIHSHAIADVTGLQTALDGKAASSHGTHVTYSTTAPKMNGTASVGTAANVSRGDHVHPTDTTRAAKTDLDALTTTVSGKADAEHTHAISEITNLQSTLNGKQATVTGGATSIVSDNLTASRALVSDANGKVAVSAVTSTELSYLDGVTSAIQAQIDSKSASGHTHSAATTSTAGFMTAAMVTKLNGIATGATKVTVDTALSASSTNPVQNKAVNSAISTLTSSVSANTSSINSHTTSIASLQAAIDEIQDITSAEISALFA